MARKKLILKIGTSTLTSGTDRISYAKIEDIARQIIALKDAYDIVLVSSGAIAAAHQFVTIGNLGKALKVESKQALAAIGQPKLVSIYDEVFSSFGLKVAQCLLVYKDFKSEVARTNIRNTIDKLLEFGYTPIINENDTVAVDEIVLGDNDKLSALVAVISDATLLVLASDINGLYTKNPNIYPDAQIIKEVNDIEAASQFIDDRASELGTGGMATKLAAAKICKEHSIEMWIVNGRPVNFLRNALNESNDFTRFI